MIQRSDPLELAQNKQTDGSTKNRLCLDAQNPYTCMESKVITLAAHQVILDKSTGAIAHTVLDIEKAFLNMTIEETCRDWFSFEFEGQVYRFVSVPFGLKTASALQQRLISAIIDESALGKYVSALRDDIHIARIQEAGQSLDEAIDKHISHVATIIKLLNKYGLPIQTEKILLSQKQVVYNGGILEKETLRADPRKINKLSRVGET